jgi:hypothetical protein
MVKGKKLSNGTVRKLAGVLTPGGCVTTRQDIEEFLAAITADRLGAPTPRRNPNAHVEAALDAAGF